MDGSRLEFVVGKLEDQPSDRYSHLNGLRVTRLGGEVRTDGGCLGDFGGQHIYTHRDARVVALLNRNFPDCSAIAIAVPVPGCNGSMTIVLGLNRDAASEVAQAISADPKTLKEVLDAVHPSLAAHADPNYFRERINVNAVEIETIPLQRRAA